MNYFQLREQIAAVYPRSFPLIESHKKVGAVREKGRKSNYQEYKLFQDEWVKQERLLNTEEVNSFVEISCRAAACPMPFNLDIWDGLVCPYNCKYCFANAFRASLYTAFFDNSRTMGIRHCNPDKYKRELDKLFYKYRGKDPQSINNAVGKAIAMEIPIRFGIRFEDFLKQEEKAGISLTMLKYLTDKEYPVMVNTKSDLIGRDDYVQALADNRGGAAVHITLISSDNQLLKLLEPGAPSYEKRVGAMADLAQENIRVVARIEPWIPFINDDRSSTEKYMADLKRIGVSNLTFDTYSYSANNPGIAQAFRRAGMDWERVFAIGCDSQGLGSILMNEYMQVWRNEGFSCSTFDMGNMPTNDQSVCCEVGDIFKGFSYGCSVMAARFLIGREGKPTSWGHFVSHVNSHGGFLSDALRREVKLLWNLLGNDAYSHAWSAGMEAVGQDGRGSIVWKFNKKSDFRRDILEGILEKV